MNNNYHDRLAYTTAQWRHCGIWLALDGGGVRYTEAIVFGTMALHLIGEPKTGFWRMTHIPTGRKVKDFALADEFWTVAEALSLDDLNTTSLRRVRERVGQVIGA